MINVRSNLLSVRKGLQTVQADVRKAQRAALNRTAQQVKVYASKQIRAGYNIKKKDVDGAIGISTAKTDLVAKVYGKKYSNVTGFSKKRNAIPLIYFNARQTLKGVRFKVRKRMQTTPGSFIATMPSGHKGVFVRRKDADWNPVTKSTLKIKELSGPSVFNLFKSDTRMKEMRSYANERFPIVYKQQLNFYMNKNKIKR
jgi:roadblock/LC7 domain-containing protein